MACVEVDVWMWSLSMPADEAAPLAMLLSADERDRADRYLAPEHRHSYIVGRGRLRKALGTYLAQAPDRIRFVYGDAGKPRIDAASAPHFNLSHSGDRAALAVCAAYPVGIDVEAIRPFGEKLAERYFSPAEVQALAALPAHERSAGFFRCWTRKEAVVKAVGGGLNIPLKSFSVSVADEADPAVLDVDGAPRDEVACWKLRDLAPGSGFAGAVALKARDAGDTLVVTFHTDT